MKTVGLAFILITALSAQPVSVEGTVVYADGTDFTGIARINLARPATDQISGSHLAVSNMQVTVHINSGSFAGPLSLYPTQYMTAVSHFKGTGVSGLLAVGGAFVLLPPDQEMIVCIQLDKSGTPDTFNWGTTTAPVASNITFLAASCINGGTGIPIISGGVPRQVIGYGIVLSWGASTGHTVGDQWGFRVRQAIAPQEFYDSSWYTGNNQLVAQFNLSVGNAAMDASMVNLALASAVWH